jgi:hypothetical protein
MAFVPTQKKNGALGVRFGHEKNRVPLCSGSGRVG